MTWHINKYLLNEQLDDKKGGNDSVRGKYFQEVPTSPINGNIGYLS